MKKQKIISVSMIIYILLIGLQFGCGGVKNTTAYNNKIIGTWQLCKKDSTVNTDIYNKGFKRYKIISNRSFVNVDIKKQKNYNTIYGSYELKDGIYTESVESTSMGFRHILGQRNSFKVKIVGDLIFFEGQNKDYGKTIWKKLK